MNDDIQAQHDAMEEAYLQHLWAVFAFERSLKTWRTESVRILGHSSWIARFDVNASAWTVPVTRHHGEVIR